MPIKSRPFLFECIIHKGTGTRPVKVQQLTLTATLIPPEVIRPCLIRRTSRPIRERGVPLSHPAPLCVGTSLPLSRPAPLPHWHHPVPVPFPPDCPPARACPARHPPTVPSPLPALACPFARMPFPLPMPACPSASVPFPLPMPGTLVWNAPEWPPSGPTNVLKRISST